MENKYNIKRNPQVPDPGEIRKHMDFDALLNAYEQAPASRQAPLRVRTLRYALSAAAAIALLLVAFNVLRGTQQEMDAATYFATQPYQSTPLATVQAVSNRQIISDAHKGGIIEYENGSRIVIPAAAFMNERGSLIGGEVEVYYHEMHDFVDFFVGGVPMMYDSLGKRRYLASAGMMDVYAMQNGKRVQLAPGKALQIELVSEVVVDDFFSLPSYFVYQLDTAARNWSYRNVDMIQFVDGESWLNEPENSPQKQWRQQLSTLEREYEQAVTDLMGQHPLPAAPFYPAKASNDQPTISLDFQNGELALDESSQLSEADLDKLYNGTIWQISASSPAVDQRAFQVVWEKVALRPLDGQRYELRLIHRDNEETLVVEPVLVGDDYQQAVAEYEAEKLAYDEAVAARENAISAARDSLKAAFEERQRELQESFRDMFQTKPEGYRRKVINRFVVTAFGVWNCAYPIDQPTTVAEVSFEDPAGNPIRETAAFVASPLHNTLFRYYAGEGSDLHVSAGMPNLVWVVKDDQLLLTRLTQLAEDEGALMLTPIEGNIQTEADLRRVLAL